ncbi:MAG: hypothetical protein RR296_12965, partial [Clostridia bacterium]
MLKHNDEHEEISTRLTVLEAEQSATKQTFCKRIHELSAEQERQADKIRYLKKLLGCLALFSAGLFVAMLEHNAEIRAIREGMNEG